MAAPIRTDLGTVLKAIRSRLVTELRWSEDRVQIFDPDAVELPPAQGDQVICIWFEGEQAENNAVGTGRHDCRERVRLVVALFTRLATDDDDSQEDWLTHASLGHLAARHDILDALVSYQPEDEDADVLTYEPLHPTSLSKPRQDRRTAGWGESRLGFAANYLLDLDQTWQ